MLSRIIETVDKGVRPDLGNLRAVAYGGGKMPLELIQRALDLFPDTGFTNVVFAWVPPELRPLDPESLSEADRSRLHRLAPRVKARMQSEGTALLGYQPVHGLNTFRLLVMNPTVGTRDVEAVLDLLARYGAEEWPGTA